VVHGTSPAAVRLIEGSLSLRWRFWLRLLSDPSLAPLQQNPSHRAPTCCAYRRFFGHPCLRLQVPFSQGPWLVFHQL